METHTKPSTLVNVIREMEFKEAYRDWQEERWVPIEAVLLNAETIASSSMDFNNQLGHCHVSIQDLRREAKLSKYE